LAENDHYRGALALFPGSPGIGRGKRWQNADGLNLRKTGNGSDWPLRTRGGGFSVSIEPGTATPRSTAIDRSVVDVQAAVGKLIGCGEIFDDLADVDRNGDFLDALAAVESNPFSLFASGFSLAPSVRL
jgi:hypothetical protein